MEFGKKYVEFCLFLHWFILPDHWNGRSCTQVLQIINIGTAACSVELMHASQATQDCESDYLLFLQSMWTCASDNLWGQSRHNCSSENPVCCQRSKHIDIRYHFVRFALGDGRITIEYCSTADRVADILTKSVTKLRMDIFVYFVFGEWKKKCINVYHDL